MVTINLITAIRQGLWRSAGGGGGGGGGCRGQAREAL